MFECLFEDFFIILWSFCKCLLVVGIVFDLIFDVVEYYFYENSLWIGLFVEDLFVNYCK